MTQALGAAILRSLVPFIPSRCSRQGVRKSAACLVAVYMWGCAGSLDAAPTTDAGQPLGGDAAAVKDSSVVQLDPQQAELVRCADLQVAVPQSIQDMVALVNLLPAPTAIPCLIASLPRPLSVVASSSGSSLQPADGVKSPRLIIMFERLLLTVVPTGDGANRLEFGEWVTPSSTLKGELRFPVLQPVAQGAPYEGLVMDGASLSSCGFCHLDEQQHPTIAGAYTSKALRPYSFYEETLASVRATRAACDQPAGDGPHCSMLRALFDFGEVRQGAFSEQVQEGF